ncbi:MAG: OsmC family protein, partial [Hyphomicrobiales bacterium]|nr:OsmC family protein [Hyphomicrobiales bacterium]
SACHKLWYLHLCSDNGVVVLSYRDNAEGTMIETKDMSGRFVDVRLRPRVVTSSDSPPDKARSLHATAHKLCFIANSVNFHVRHEAEITIAAPEGTGS